ncbi:MAG: ATP-dependent 6-phosphofructokinase [Deltaproteobacteria bacterium]|nr:ATP-dependent 6-phosphofructokinase [Deltaproteobacteria bacterium]
MTDAFNTEIETLGPCTVRSPLRYHRYVSDSDRALYSQNLNNVMAQIKAGHPLISFELAGPREMIFFDPSNVKAAIVTCGGLCPGLNDVIRAIVHELTYMYGVKHIKGVQYGYAGLNPNMGFPLIDLTPNTVKYIHEDGGTILGSSRGPQPIDVIVDTLYREEIRMLFTIGGDGTLKGAHAIRNEIERRGLKIAVIGVPKTIDNDINLVSRTFGFETAVGSALESLRCAHSEAEGAINGIGIVKLMGRNSGFVAAYAALASGDANFVLVPEVPFEFDGPNGFLSHLEKRISERHHALVVVAEGAGQNLFSEPTGVDRSGNRKLADIGLLVKQRVGDYFTRLGLEHSVKYIDPSYMIRSVPATADDGVFCLFLGQQAAHAGMAGKTGLLVGLWNDVFTHIPIEAAIQHRKHIEPKGILWMSVLESTGQPERMVNESIPAAGA